MLKSRKHVFWEALLLTIVVFFLGILIGIAFEGNRLDSINEYYVMSEISLMDISAFNELLEKDKITCEELVKYNLDFADRIYEEAKQLERYDDAGKITDSLKLAHKKYDLMRTFAWIMSRKTMEKCYFNQNVDFNIVVYLYEYETRDLAKKATQKVWEKVLYDLKQEFGEKIVLIPISADNNLLSLDSMTNEFNIIEYPVVIINDKDVISNLESVEDIKKYLG